jgi:elongation factor 1 alpha-like protein
LCNPTADSIQLASSGRSSLTAKKKTPVLSEEVPVERTNFQLKGDESSCVSSTSLNNDVTQKLSPDISQLCLGKNNVNVAKPCLPEEYKPEAWMLADQEPGVLNQLNLAIVGHHSSLL